MLLKHTSSLPKDNFKCQVNAKKKTIVGVTDWQDKETEKLSCRSKIYYSNALTFTITM